MSTASLKDELKKLICEIAEIDDLPEDASFKDLGIDSMMGVEIVAAIERQYKIKIEDAEIAKISTLASSYELVRGKVETALAESA